MYFLMVDRFHNGDASNDLDADRGRADWWQGGDLRGVIEKLDHVVALGATAIWLTPVARQTRGGYHGYWTLDHYTVDPHFGDLETLQRLVNEAHARGLRVVLDVVVNHVGYEHPWLADGAHAGWFHEPCPVSFTDPKSVESCWIFGLPDLDTEDARVRAYLMDWGRWLVRETRVDGFRVDAARHVPKEFLREWLSAVRAERGPGPRPPDWALAEVFVSSYRAQAPYLEVGFDAFTDFETYEALRQALSPIRPDMARLGAVPGLAADVGVDLFRRALFVDNHDVPRFVGPDPADAGAKARLRLALAYVLTMPGTPILYYGTEVALAGGRDPDNRRAMPWDALPNPEVLAFTTELVRLRRDLAALRRGGLSTLLTTRDHLAYARTLDGQSIVVTMNASPSERAKLRVPAAATPFARLVPLLDVPGSSASTGIDGAATVSLPPRSVQLWRVEGAPTPVWLLGAIALVAAFAAAVVARRLRSRR